MFKAQEAINFSKIGSQKKDDKLFDCIYNYYLPIIKYLIKDACDNGDFSIDLDLKDIPQPNIIKNNEALDIVAYILRNILKELGYRVSPVNHKFSSVIVVIWRPRKDEA
jgi:hypothetical protein